MPAIPIIKVLVFVLTFAQTPNALGLFQKMRKMGQPSNQVGFGSLFPALHRMEEKGWLLAEWRTSEHNRRAKYYALTKSRRKQLREEQRQWSLVVKALSTALRSS